MLLEAGHARWDTADHYTPGKHRLTCLEASNLTGVPFTSSPINHTKWETLLCAVGHLCRNQLLQQAQVGSCHHLQDWHTHLAEGVGGQEQFCEMGYLRICLPAQQQHVTETHHTR